MSSIEKNVYFSLLAPIPLLWHSVKWPRGQSHFSQKYTYKRFEKNMQVFKTRNAIPLNVTRN